MTKKRRDGLKDPDPYDLEDDEDEDECECRSPWAHIAEAVVACVFILACLAYCTRNQW